MAEEVVVQEPVQVPQGEGAPQAPAQPAAAPAAPAAVEVSGQVEAPKMLTQDEVNAIVARERAKERRRLERELAHTRQQPTQQQPEAPAAPVDDRPKPEQFSNNWDEYTVALSQWATRQALSHAKAEQEAAARTRAQLDAATQFAHARDAVLDAVAEKYGDATPFLTAPMIEALDSPTDAAAVAVYLGAHPEEQDRVAKLTPARQAREAERILAKLTAAPTPKPSAAPAPIAPVNAAHGTTVDPMKLAKDDPSAYRAYMNEQEMAARRKGR